MAIVGHVIQGVIVDHFDVVDQDVKNGRDVHVWDLDFMYRKDAVNGYDID